MISFLQINLNCCSFGDYQDFLSWLERSIRLATEGILLAGDFNAKHSDWGSKTNDPKGEALSDMIHALGLIVCNKGNDPTFKSGSIIDVTFCSAELAGAVSGWGVLDVESLSDHCYIQYNINTDQSPSTSVPPPSTKWKYNHKKLEDAISSEQLSGVLVGNSADECAAQPRYTRPA